MALKDNWIDKVDDVDINSAEDINQVAHAVIELEESGGNPGENGATFTPNVSAEGVISWTNDQELPNPEPVNIKGNDGNGIASAVLNADYTLTLTFTDGTSYTTSSIRGAKGADGESVMVDEVTLSAESGGVNTVTFSDGNVLEVRNGEKGADGEGSVWHNGTEITGTGTNIFCPVAKAGLGDYYLNTETGNAYHCAESNTFWNYIGTLKGQSGVYAGSGDMPEDCNVQIDPDGEVLTVESIAEEVSEIINAEDKTAFIPETTVNFADYGGEYTIESDLKFDSKKAYKVIWDGASYECNVATVDEDGVILSFIGSKSFLTGEDDGIPFVFATYSNDSFIAVLPALDEGGNPIVEDRDITFSVFEITEKYARLPVCQFETVTADGEMFKVLKGVSFDYLTNPRTVQIDGVLYNTSYSAQDNYCIASCMYPKSVTDIYTEAITLVHGVIENESVWVYAYKTTGKISGTFVSSDAQ